MKRYMLFAGGDNFYPNGGAYDHIESFDTVDECHTRTQLALDHGVIWSWWHIMDAVTGNIVFRA